MTVTTAQEGSIVVVGRGRRVVLVVAGRRLDVEVVARSVVGGASVVTTGGSVLGVPGGTPALLNTWGRGSALPWDTTPTPAAAAKTGTAINNVRRQLPHPAIGVCSAPSCPALRKKAQSAPNLFVSTAAGDEKSKHGNRGRLRG